MKVPTLEDRVKATQRPDDQTCVMRQSWEELLFLHWEIPAEEIQSTLPEGLTVDTFEGKAYLGVVPFYMKGVRPRFLPAVPSLSNFLELNVRTYVHDKEGRPGVWFYSLDANQKIAVWLAQTLFKLPYFDAVMSLENVGGVNHYASQQKGSAEMAKYAYSAGDDLEVSEPGSLQYFLAERYYLFSYNADKNKLYSGRVYHQPYPLKIAHVESYSDYPIELAGFKRPGRNFDHAIMSHGVDVEVFPLKEI